jgi:Fic family protein
MQPPYTITNDIINLVADISLILGRFHGLKLPGPQPELRKQVQILTIHSSLAIEGNTLSVDQITDVINDRHVSGPEKDILEVKNALEVYEMLDNFDPYSMESLLQAHRILMQGLIQGSGKFRRKNVGVKSGNKMVHLAPSHKMVSELMEHLFQFLRNEKDIHPLIISSIFHYEFEFIHPFMDGNGRMGRLWQSLILRKDFPIMDYIPIETIIRKNQGEYYQALSSSSKQGESTIFITFMLKTIKEAAIEFTDSYSVKRTSAQLRISSAQNHFKDTEFSRKDYMEFYPDISSATASRDLAWAVDNELLKKSGDKATTKYEFK